MTVLYKNVVIFYILHGWEQNKCTLLHLIVIIVEGGGLDLDLLFIFFLNDYHSKHNVAFMLFMSFVSKKVGFSVDVCTYEDVFHKCIFRRW